MPRADKPLLTNAPAWNWLFACLTLTDTDNKPSVESIINPLSFVMVLVSKFSWCNWELLPPEEELLTSYAKGTSFEATPIMGVPPIGVIVKLMLVTLGVDIYILNPYLITCGNWRYIMFGA